MFCSCSKREAVTRRASGLGFDEEDLVAAVCAAIRRVVGPFHVILASLLPNSHVLARFDLKDIQPKTVQIRLFGNLTGPSATYTTVVRHPRLRAGADS